MTQEYRERIFARYWDTKPKEITAWMPGSPVAAYGPTYRKLYLPHIPSDRDASILEIGSGQGFLLSFLQQNGYRNGRGIDRSPQMSALARRLGAPTTEADAMDYLPNRRGEFDCVIAVDVLEHLFKEEVLKLMDAVFGALKPGGRFVLQTVNADGLSWGRLRYGDFTHEQAFTRYSLAQLFQTAGFSHYAFYPTEGVVTDLRSFMRRLAWKAFRLAAGLYYHLEMGTGILHNDHLLTANLVAVATKPREA